LPERLRGTLALHLRDQPLKRFEQVDIAALALPVQEAE
jgi:hypothetical protein